MIRFCNREDVSEKDYETAQLEERLLLDENVWEKGREKFKYSLWNDDKLHLIPIVNRMGEIICFAYQDKEADRELRFLKEIQETDGALQFMDLFPDKTSVTILGCNELAYYFLQYLKRYDLIVYTAGKYWEELGYQQKYAEADLHNLVIYAEGSTQDYLGKYSVNKMLCSMSAEFECIDQIYEENFRKGMIRDKNCQFSDLINIWGGQKKELIILGTSDQAQDAYDLLLKNGIDIRAFMQDGFYGSKMLFGKPVMNRSEVFRNIREPVLIQCQDTGSALGTGDVDSYGYYGYGRNKAFFLLKDYTEIPESRLVHILRGKKIVLAGDQRLCAVLERFYKKNFEDGISIRYIDDKTKEKIEDEIVVQAFYSPYGGVTVNDQLRKRQQIIQDAITDKGIDHTKYFETIEHFIGMESEEKKYALDVMRPKGILLGKIPALSGNIFFRDILDGHPQILKMDYVFLNDNLLSYCLRLADMKAEDILPSFWEIYHSELDSKYLEGNFPDKEAFNQKLQSLLSMAEKFSSQELFVIFTVAYEAMFDEIRVEELKDKVLYWEPHFCDRDKFQDYARWLEDPEIAGRTVNITRNNLVLAGAYMNLDSQGSADLWKCFRDMIRQRSYKSDNWKEFTVRFEDLKLAPAKTIGSVCEQIGVVWNENLLQTTNRGKSNGYFSTTGFDLRPVYDSYEEYLSAFDRFRVSVLTACRQRKYGYPYYMCMEFSRRALQEMFLKAFRFDEKVHCQECEEKMIRKRRTCHMMRDFLWNERKKFLMAEVQGEALDGEYEDISKVHRYWTGERENALREIKKMQEFISGYEQVIMYGTGRDAKYIFDHLCDDEKSKLIYSDKKALKGFRMFEGREVISPRHMIQRYKTAGIIITSSQYGEDIWRVLTDMGIDDRRIFRNQAVHAGILNPGRR